MLMNIKNKNCVFMHWLEYFKHWPSCLGICIMANTVLENTSQVSGGLKNNHFSSRRKLKLL